MSTVQPILVTGAAGRLGGVGGAVVEALRWTSVVPVRRSLREKIGKSCKDSLTNQQPPLRITR
jgi:hypothetical protein